MSRGRAEFIIARKKKTDERRFPIPVPVFHGKLYDAHGMSVCQNDTEYFFYKRDILSQSDSSPTLFFFFFPCVKKLARIVL